jgi:hypothetical protein
VHGLPIVGVVVAVVAAVGVVATVFVGAAVEAVAYGIHATVAEPLG